MKFHLPIALRVALLPCVASITPLLTLATATITCIAPQTQAANYTVNGVGQTIFYEAIAGDLITMDLTGWFAPPPASIRADINVVKWEINGSSGGVTLVFDGAITGEGDIVYTAPLNQNTYDFKGDMSGFKGDISANNLLILKFSGVGTTATSGTGAINSVNSITYTNTGDSTINNSSINITGSGSLNLNGGANYVLNNTVNAAQLAVASTAKVAFGGAATFTSSSSMSANITVNTAANLTLGGTVSFTGEITNNGTLTFIDGVKIDLSGLTAVAQDDGRMIYTLFAEGSTGTLYTDNLSIGSIAGNAWIGTSDWVFHNDGTISYTLNATPLVFSAGGELRLGKNTVGFEDDGKFTDGNSITFKTADTDIILTESISSSIFMVDGVNVTLKGGGNLLNTGSLTLDNGGTLTIKDNALAADERILLGAGATGKFISDSDTVDIAANSWLADFNGDVLIKSGSFTTANHETTFSSLTINAGASFTYGGGQSTTYNINLEGATSTGGTGASMTIIGGVHTGAINITGTGNTINASAGVKFNGNFTGGGNFTLKSGGIGDGNNVQFGGDTIKSGGILTLDNVEVHWKDGTLAFTEIIIESNAQFTIFTENMNLGDAELASFKDTTFTLNGGKIWYESGAGSGRLEMMAMNVTADSIFAFSVGSTVNIDIVTLTGVAKLSMTGKDAAKSFNIDTVKDYHGSIDRTGFTSGTLTIQNIDQAKGKNFKVTGGTVNSLNLTKTGEGSANLHSLTLAADGIITNDGGTLTIGKLIAGNGTIAANAGTTTISDLGSSNMAASVAANATLNVGTGSLASLDSAGAVTSTGDLTVAGNVTGTGSIDATGSVILNGASNTVNTIKATGSITATGDIKAKSITATEGAVEVASLTLTGNAISVMDSLEITNSLTLSHVSQINVTNVLTVSSITINGSNLASADSPTTALITAGSIAGESLTVTLTTDALANMNFDIDGQFTLIDLGTAYEGEFIFNIEGVTTLDLASNTGIELGEEFQVGDGTYIITSVDNDNGGQQIIITEVAAIPEPSTATLSLLALAGLLARRRRKQA